MVRNTSIVACWLTIIAVGVGYMYTRLWHSSFTGLLNHLVTRPQAILYMNNMIVCSNRLETEGHSAISRSSLSRIIF